MEVLDQDLSTLASLEPGSFFENPYQRTRSSQRYQGSFALNLAKPSKLPENGREYQPGDAVSMIDWRAYARTNQLLVREVRDEASAHVICFLDTSSNMFWPDQSVALPKDAPSKIEIAVRAAFYTAYQHLRLGDFVEIWLIDDAEQAVAKVPSRTPSDVIGSYSNIARLGFTEGAIQRTSIPATFFPKKKDIGYWFGDGLAGSSWLSFLQAAKHGIFIQTLSDYELDEKWLKEDVAYYDELGHDLTEYLGRSLLQQSRYQQGLQAWLDKLQTTAKKNRLVMKTFSESTPIVTFNAVLKSHKLSRMGR